MPGLPDLSTLDAAALEALVSHHNHLYWDLNSPELADTDYDLLVEALRARQPDSPVLRALGPTRFGAEVVHAAPMLSLDKAYSLDELWAFIEKPKSRERKVEGALVVSPKIDGVACSLRYDAAGQLVLAATRGDGVRGEDITANVRRVDEIPGALKTGTIEVRGELYLRRSRFAQNFAADFVNARNLTAGAIKQKDPSKTASYGLSFFAYDLLGSDVASEQVKLARLTNMGFAVLPHERVQPQDADALWQVVERMRGVALQLDCDTDGVVLKADDLAEQVRLGATDHHPRFAIAFKFKAETGNSPLQSVEWSVSRTGRITPVAVVEPVFLSGANVSRASLHNLEIFEKLGLSEGCVVELSRRGEVIPQVEGVVQSGGAALALPVRCPSCQGPVERRDKFLTCCDPDACPAALVGTLEHFAKTLDVEGFGERLLRALVTTGTVRRPRDFFSLTVDALLALRGAEVEGEKIRIGDRLAQKLVEALQARRRIPLTSFLTALGIEDLGPVMAEKLVDNLGDLAAIRQASAEQLTALEGFGEERARSVVDGLQRLAPRIDALLQQIEVVQVQAPAVTGHPLCGKSVVFTGTLALMDRKTAQQKVRERGGKTPGSVTQDLDYLVIGDKGSPLLGEGARSSKHKTADKYVAQGSAMRILRERDFFQMLDEKGGV
ncbi:MAG: NAD-dependent DNA ligase LigA [Pseudomonadota bacterium]